MLDEALIELLRPLIREVVRVEVERVHAQQRWLSVRQAAVYLGIKEPAVRQRIRAGQLQAKRLDGRIYVDIAEHEHRLDALP